MGYYQRKFHLRYTLDDGNIWRGFINVEADTREDLQSRNEIRGTFWCEKLSEGWRGTFNLEDTLSDRRAVPNPYGFSSAITQSVVTVGVFLPEVNREHCSEIRSTQEAESILRSISSISSQYETISRFAGRLEDCIISEETHYWDD